MIRVIPILFLFALTITGCNSLRYSSYDRPLDFLKVHRVKVKKNTAALEQQSTPDSTTFSIQDIPKEEVAINTEAPLFSTNNEVEILKRDSVIDEANHQPTGRLPIVSALRKNRAHLIKSKLETANAKIKAVKKDNKPFYIDWGEIVLITLGVLAFLFLMAVLFSYLQTTPSGQIILAIIILALILVGIVIAFTSSNTVLLDILDIIFWLLL